MKLIDKSAIVAEIERKMNLCKKILLRSRTRQNDDYHQGNIDAYEVVISLLDTLEVKEVDLEKEIDNIWNPRFSREWDEKSLLYMNHEGFTIIAKHFFELGLKAKGE